MLASELTETHPQLLCQMVLNFYVNFNERILKLGIKPNPVIYYIECVRSKVARHTEYRFLEVF